MKLLNTCWQCLQRRAYGEWFEFGERFTCAQCLEGNQEKEMAQLEVWAFMHSLGSIGWEYGEHNTQPPPDEVWPNDLPHTFHTEEGTDASGPLSGVWRYFKGAISRG